MSCSLASGVTTTARTEASFWPLRTQEAGSFSREGKASLPANTSAMARSTVLLPEPLSPSSKVRRRKPGLPFTDASGVKSSAMRSIDRNWLISMRLRNMARSHCWHERHASTLPLRLTLNPNVSPTLKLIDPEGPPAKNHRNTALPEAGGSW